MSWRVFSLVIASSSPYLVITIGRPILYHTIIYCTILYYDILLVYYTILYHTILYYTILYYTILSYTIPYYTILYYPILYYPILYYTILYYAILYYHILLYTILYYTFLYNVEQEKLKPHNKWINNDILYLIANSMILSWQRSLFLSFSNRMVSVVRGKDHFLSLRIAQIFLMKNISFQIT